MNKLNRFLLILGASCCIHLSQAQQPQIQGHWNELFAGPASLGQRDEWLQMMKNWRQDQRTKLSYDDAAYRKPALSWIQQSFIFVQLMAHDRYLYDPVQGRYTVDRYLDDLKQRYGGIDAVLVWPTYPNIGTDNRNQFDMFRDMPGGLDGLRQLVKDFHRREVKVFFPIMIWDHGTRPIDEPMALALVREMQAIGADGLIGDTMNGVGKEFQDACDSLGISLVLEPELNLGDLKMISWNHMSWGYFWDYTPIPGLSIYKWFEPRHQVHVTNRWATDKTDDLQYAFFNGIGYNPWENIWGIWNGVSKKDAAYIKRISAIYRQFPGQWNSAEWEPFFPTLQPGVFASRFPKPARTIYTLINRDSVPKKGFQIRLLYQANRQYFDLWNGTKITPQREGNEVKIPATIPARGFGAILSVDKKQIPKALLTLLSTLGQQDATDAKKSPDVAGPLLQKITEIAPTQPAATAPPDMVLIPAIERFLFESKGVMIEGDELPQAIGIQYPWQSHPARSQQHHLSIPAFYMDKYPVTNQQFKAFLDASGYHPRDDHNFLKNWTNGTYPAGWEQKPVTWVSLEDARAYASWAGKRLPHEWEWQYAAQGPDRQLYPWGNEMDSTKIPLPHTGRNLRPPTAVQDNPQGANPFGLMDLVGNVWQWTDEYQDAHSRFAVLKGGSYYNAQGSHWYFPQIYELNKYGKYLLMAPSLDRAATIGFRLCKDR